MDVVMIRANFTLAASYVLWIYVMPLGLIIVLNLFLFVLGTKFPDKPPVLTLRSVYHGSKGKPKQKVLASCPYSNFEGYIEQQVEIFKNECNGISSQIVHVDN